MKEKGRFSASGVGPAVPLWCAPRWWGAEPEEESWGRFQMESMGRAEGAAVSVCGVQESPWQVPGVFEMEKTEQLCFCLCFFWPAAQHLPLLPNMPLHAVHFSEPCHFSSWSLKNNNKIVCHFVIFNLNLHFHLLLHPSE